MKHLYQNPVAELRMIEMNDILTLSAGENGNDLEVNLSAQDDE